ncbi:hypothetical protein [Granulicella arctica]|uniref:TonB-dependent transporter Oar-like beta-barrel domain-containing protein n=1 Tax=Granulicella arctica TaxID=940613 RepID=A0A7Y9PJC1_9BACT|nr:hypothetical protein [Granulicella arctica]NYF80820.1 hypothetical protein [Granulicella arctica]
MGGIYRLAGRFQRDDVSNCLADNSLYNPTSTLSNLFPAGYVSAPGASLRYLAGVGGGISFYNPAPRFGETWGYSLGVQRQLTRDDVLDLSYVGKNFTKGPTADAINRPSAGWHSQCNAETGVLTHLSVTGHQASSPASTRLAAYWLQPKPAED